MKVLKEHLEHTCEALEKVRYALNGCIFTPYGTVSTDGRRLHETPHCHDVWDDGDCSAVHGVHGQDGKARYSREPIFPVREPLAQAFVKLCKPIARGEEGYLFISYDETDGYFHLESPHGAKMKIPGIEGLYPDYQSILPMRGKGGIKLCFDADYLRQMATAFKKTGGVSVEHQGIVVESRFSDLRSIDKSLHNLGELFGDKAKQSAGKDTMIKSGEQLESLSASIEKLRGTNDDAAVFEQNGHYALIMPLDGHEPNGGTMTDKKRTDAREKMLFATGLKKISASVAKKAVARKRAARKKAAEDKHSTLDHIEVVDADLSVEEIINGTAKAAKSKKIKVAV